MSDTKEQVLSFLSKCEELKSCKFIMATTKIKDLFKCIVNCPLLYRLFEAVTKDFNYPLTKSQCLVTVDDGVLPRSYVALPQGTAQKLAFIFCLLVEFDKETINLNAFLEKYFPEDGSFYASYQAFCNTIIRELQNIVYDTFKDELALSQRSSGEDSSAKLSGLISAIGVAVAGEIAFIGNSSLPEDDKENGKLILTELLNAVRAYSEALVTALASGYNYFVLQTGCVSDGITEFGALLDEYVKYL